MADKMQNSKQAKKQNAKEDNSQKMPRISVKIDRLIDSADLNIKARVSANIGPFAVHNITVMDSKNGLFVQMPQSSFYKSNGEKMYTDLFHPVTAEARTALYNAVLKAYEQKLTESQNQTNSEQGSSQKMN